MTPPLDTPLLQAFIERGQPDTNTFHMPFGEMKFTIHDVWYILGVPVGGKALLEQPGINPCHTVSRFLCRTKQDLTGHRGLIARANVLGVVNAAKLFLFCLLGSTLFVDKTYQLTRVQLINFVKVMSVLRSMYGRLLQLLGFTGNWGRLLEHIYLDVQGVYICCSRGFMSISHILGILWYILSDRERMSLYVGGGHPQMLLLVVQLGRIRGWHTTIVLKIAWSQRM
ncbi:Serine/threonine-protein phosphatase 7 long form homolog [Linum grandiflorum]